MALLRWAGSKTKLLGELAKRLPSDYSRRAHVEPFAGSAALFFHLRPVRAVLSDACAPLMNFYQALRRNPEGLHSLCYVLAEDFNLDPKRSYARARSHLNLTKAAPPGAVALAASFWIVNQACFNGLWRENSSGEMNVPIGSKKELTAPSVAEFLSASETLIGAVLSTNRVSVSRWSAEEDFVYADPPYDEGFTQYSANGWKRTDLVELRDVLKAFGGPWMLSNADTPFVRETFAGFRIEKVTVHRSMRPNGKRTADELIIRNY